MALPRVQESSPEGDRAGRLSPEVMVDPRLLQANERTFLAWIRTALGLMAFGFVIARLGLWLRLIQSHPESDRASVSVVIGASVIVFAAALCGAAGARFVTIRKQLRSGGGVNMGPGLELLLAVAVGSLGVSLATYLLLR